MDVAAEPPPSADAAATPEDVRVRRRWPTVVRHTWPVGLTTLLLALGWVGLASSAALHDTAPLLLVALRPTPSIILLAGPHAPFAAALVVAAAGRCLFDVAVFGTSRNNIRSFLLPRPLGGRLVRWLSRRGTERGLLWFCLVNTNIPVDTALGTSSVPWRRFVRFVGAGLGDHVRRLPVVVAGGVRDVRRRRQLDRAGTWPCSFSRRRRSVPSRRSSSGAEPPPATATDGGPGTRTGRPQRGNKNPANTDSVVPLTSGVLYRVRRSGKGL